MFLKIRVYPPFNNKIDLFKEGQIESGLEEYLQKFGNIQAFLKDYYLCFERARLINVEKFSFRINSYPSQEGEVVSADYYFHDVGTGSFITVPPIEDKVWIYTYPFRTTLVSKTAIGTRFPDLGYVEKKRRAGLPVRYSGESMNSQYAGDITNLVEHNYKVSEIEVYPQDPSKEVFVAFLLDKSQVCKKKGWTSEEKDEGRKTD